jgi:hypothetical protein
MTAPLFFVMATVLIGSVLAIVTTCTVLQERLPRAEEAGRPPSDRDLLPYRSVGAEGALDGRS